ncbi:MAG: GNAT family N-acetyltransferase [Bacteroidales bacterium]
MKKVLCKDINSSLFKRTWEIYTDAFKISEQRKLENHINALSDVRFHPYSYINESDKDLLGLFFTWEFENFSYIEYFAVNSNFRNQGIGSKILNEQIKEHKNKPLILEITPVSDEISKRRLDFYKRNGFLESEFLFVHLPYRKNCEQSKLQLLSNIPIKEDLYQDFIQNINNELIQYCEL